MNEQEERMEDRPNQKIWFDGGNREWKLDGRSRTFRRKVRNIRWRNNKLEGTVIYNGKNINVRYVSEGDWNAHFSYKDDAELERDYGRGAEAEFEKNEAERFDLAESRKEVLAAFADEIAEIGNLVGNGDVFTAMHRAYTLSADGVISDEIGKRLGRLQDEISSIHSYIHGLIEHVPGEPLEPEKKVVLLQKEGPDFEQDETLLEEGALLSEIIEPDFDEENYTAEQLLVRTKNKITAEYVRIGVLIDWLDEKEDALHVSPEWESIKNALNLSRSALVDLRAAAGAISIGINFFREDFSGSDFNTSSQGDKFESEKDETIVEPEICPECNGDESYHDASGSKMIQCPKCKGNGILVIELR